MRLPFALCAWALLLAAPGVHSLRLVGRPMLSASPQAMIWRSDRDTIDREHLDLDHHIQPPEGVETSGVEDFTTSAQSTDLVEVIIINHLRDTNSTVQCQVGRPEGRQADTQVHHF